MELFTRIDGVLAGTNAYTYDVLNRATQITQSGVGVQGKRVDMSYDAVNQLTGLSRYTILNSPLWLILVLSGLGRN